MCGVVAVFNVSDPGRKILNMLNGLPHRGENGAGIVLGRESGDFIWERSELSVGALEVVLEGKNVSGFSYGVGHIRYGTAGDRRIIDNTHPLKANILCGEVYLAHNGDSPFAEEDSLALKNKGQIFWTSTDSEIILQNMSLSDSDDLIESLKCGLYNYRGTYAIAMLAKDKSGSIKLLVARDKYGNRPLKLAKIGNGYAVASEDVAFEKIGADYIRDIAPGEMLIISKDGLQTELTYGEGVFGPLRQCVYELVYFSDPTSEIFGIPVSGFRELLGSLLAKRYGSSVHDHDVVSYIPDSAKYYGEGFCNTLNKKLETLILRTHATRSFIQDGQFIREDTIRRKLNFDRHKIKQILKRNPFTRFWFVDDSIVRGNVSRKIISAFKNNSNSILKSMGYDHAVWVGWLSAAPALLGPCQKGIDMPGKEGQLFAPQFLASQYEVDTEAMAKNLDCNFVGYSHLSDIYDAVRFSGKRVDDYCFGCFENRDPVWNKW